MSGKLTVRDFFKRFPNDDACLDHVMSVRYGMRHVCSAHADPETGEVSEVSGTAHRITGRKAYACARCGAHIYPCANTIFQDSRTPLTLWFYAIYLFVTTRHGVSGKELQRQLGVTYKTAWRMGQQIRQLMEKADEFTALRGHVELDETYIGGYTPRSKGTPFENKTVVMGLAERGGKKRAQVIPDASTASLKKVVLENVEPRTTISTDEAQGLRLTHQVRLSARHREPQGRVRPHGRGRREASHK